MNTLNDLFKCTYEAVPSSFSSEKLKNIDFKEK